MKLAFALLLCVGATLAAPQPHPKPIPIFRNHVKLAGFKPATLSEDFEDIFVNNIDILKLGIVALGHLASDPALSAALAYLKSDTFQDYATSVLNKPQIQDLTAWLLEKGVDLNAGLDLVDSIILGAEPGADPDESASLVPFLDDVISCIDVDNVIATVEDKLQTSPDFQEFWVKISSEDAHALVDEVIQEEEAQHIGSLLEGMGVDVDAIIAGIYQALGWGDPPLN